MIRLYLRENQDCIGYTYAGNGQVDLEVIPSNKSRDTVSFTVADYLDESVSIRVMPYDDDPDGFTDIATVDGAKVLTKGVHYTCAESGSVYLTDLDFEINGDYADYLYENDKEVVRERKVVEKLKSLGFDCRYVRG